MENYVAPKPIIFCIKDGQDGQDPKVLFEIDGDKNLIETQVSRRNEEDFFKFANDFDTITSANRNRSPSKM